MTRRAGRAAVAMAAALGALHAAYAHAAATPKDIFQSMDDAAPDPSGLLPVVGLVVTGIAVLSLLAWLNKRVRRKGVDLAYNNPSRLLREVGKSVGLKRAEVRQLKLLADACAGEAGGAPSPLTLLLCPSMMAKAVAKNPAKIDRQVLAGLVKQLSRSHT